MIGDIIRRSAAVERRLSTLARSLYAAENSVELAFVRSQKDVKSPTGQMASELLRTLGDVWAAYPPVRDVVQEIGRSVAQARWGDAERLLRPDALALPTGAPIGADELLVALQQQVDQIVAGTSYLADRARQAYRRWSRMRNSRWPWRKPEDGVEMLEQQRLMLPAALTSARTQLVEIRRLVRTRPGASFEHELTLSLDYELAATLARAGRLDESVYRSFWPLEMAVH